MPLDPNAESDLISDIATLADSAAEIAPAGWNENLDLLGEETEAVAFEADAWDTFFEEEQDEIRELGKRWETACAEIGEAVERMTDFDLKERIETKLEEAATTLTERLVNCEEALEKGVAEALEEITEAGTNLKGLAEKEATQAVQRAVTSTGDAAIDRVKQEVATAIVNAQIGSQLSTVLAPYVPQLAAAKAALSTIRRLRDLM